MLLNYLKIGGKWMAFSFCYNFIPMMEFLFAKCGTKSQDCLDESVVVEGIVFDNSCHRETTYMRSSNLSINSKHYIPPQLTIGYPRIPSQKSII